jgi:hypothetical protein
MDNIEQLISVAEIEPQRECGEPLLVEWMESEWFQVWLKLARHEEREAV